MFTGNKVFYIAALCLIGSCEKKSEEVEPDRKLVWKGSLGVQAQSSSLTPPTGSWKLYCEQIGLSTNSCSADVSAAGAFEITCDQLGTVPFQCFLKKDSTHVSLVSMDEQWLMTASGGQLEADIAFDSTTSFAKATLKTSSTAVPLTQLMSPSDFEGTYSLTCEAAASGFGGCTSTSWYLHKVTENDPARYGIWESKTIYDACASETSPSFRFAFNGTDVYRMAFDANSLAEPMQEAATAFFGAAPSALTLAADSVLSARQASFTYTGYVLDEMRVNLMQQLVALDAIALDTLSATCTLYDALSSANKLSATLAYSVLCTMSKSDQAAAVTWLKNTREKSCVPLLTFDRVYDSTSSTWFTRPTCFGSQKSSACYDKGGNYIGALAGRVGLVRMRMRGSGVEWVNVDQSNGSLVNSSSTASTCQNLFLSVLGLASTAEGEWSGIWSRNDAHGCALAGTEKTIAGVSATDPVFATTSYRVKLKKQ